MIGEEKKSDIRQHTKIPNLDVITSGPVPPNPSELLIGTATDELIKSLKEEYDCFILDTPPVGLVSDALELLKYADSTIYVVRQAYSQKGMLKMINDKYRKQEISNVSMVLNDFKVKSKYGYVYGYGKYANGYHEIEEQSFLRKLFKRKK